MKKLSVTVSQVTDRILDDKRPPSFPKKKASSKGGGDKIKSNSVRLF